MSRARPSWTAEGVAAIRALEAALHPPGRRVFDDPIAARVVRGWPRLASRSRGLASAAIRYHQWFRAGLVNEVPARARYVAEHLNRLAGEGVGQVVILGAGFDGTAWLPDLPDGLVIYEVDRPETQRLKRARLKQAGIEEPSRVIFVPAQLPDGRLSAALEGAGFLTGKRALVTAMGLLMYLPPPSVTALFEEIGAAFAADSEILYDHFSRYMLDPARRPAGVRRAARRLARRGEPFLSGAEPDEMASLAARARMRQVESLDGLTLTARYFAPLGDPRTIVRGVHVARAVVSRSSC